MNFLTAQGISLFLQILVFFSILTYVLIDKSKIFQDEKNYKHFYIPFSAIIFVFAKIQMQVYSSMFYSSYPVADRV